MKRVVTTFIVIAFVLSMAGLSNASIVTYNGNVTPFQLGGTATTDLPMFNGAGTLTGVQIDLSLTVTPYAQILNVGTSPAVFTSSDWITFGYTPADIWTVSHGSDSWNLAAPTVDTGTIYGSGQTVVPWVLLTLVGGNSAPVSLTASGLNLAGYIGAGTLSFGTSGAGQVHITDGALYGGGGGNLTGTASVTYEYTPEPATMCLLGLGVLGLLKKRRA